MNQPQPSDTDPLVSGREVRTELSSARRNATLGILAVVGALNLIDRQIFSIFMPQIGEDLNINHQQLGLVAGLSFSVFYVLAAFPIARLADRGDRPLIISICVAVWSLSTAACAFAGSMVQLILLRIGLAAGEGGAGPAAQSLALDIFPVERRAFVLGVLVAAGSLGLGAGGAIGGWLSQWLDWRESLIAVGLPGLLVAAAAWLWAGEPRRIGARTLQAPPAIPLGEVVRTILYSPTMVWFALTTLLVTLVGFPFVIWVGSFYQIVHGMTPMEAGAALFLPLAGGLMTGQLLSGWLGDHIAKGRPKGYGRIAAVGLIIAFPLGLAAAQAASAPVSLIFFFCFQVAISMQQPVLYALAFSKVRPTERAMLGAFINLVTTLCGLGAGTWLVGALSTGFAERYGDLSLRYALTAVCFTLPLAAACALMAGRAASAADDRAQGAS
ncbi:MAG: MFS transporter [Novosphingobium sp.]|nr:MFS transporter [Novosphingobium sp.]